MNNVKKQVNALMVISAIMLIFAFAGIAGYIGGACLGVGAVFTFYVGSCMKLTAEKKEKNKTTNAILNHFDAWRNFDEME